MENRTFGTKELSKVVLKATSNMKIGEKTFEIGEPVLYFEKAQLASLSESSRAIFARGGKQNLPIIIWEDRSEMKFTIQEGVMSNIGLAVLSNAKVFSNKQDGRMRLSKTEILKVGDDGTVYLKYSPIENDKNFVYLYDGRNIQEKLVFSIEGNQLTISEEYASRQILVEYYFYYGKESWIYVLDSKRFNGTFSLEGRYYSTDEDDGLLYTNVLYMPRVKIMSNMNLRLGEKADPMITQFNINALPYDTDYSENSYLEIYSLDEDID